ncbi:hypothetical protein RvY_16365 [Ramazzottius varieornatus]|uniref:Uncharacterized protein n=1 Tax=Ramazzottius varieornatus TaxID=947166 RepID=A0A1D1VZG5_RAMVA|nr:hypothetical protein RvY_16365 [Ramazzottius varieornatus]
MTNGDYRALRAFQSLIILNNPNPDWANIQPLLTDVWNVTKGKYSHPLTADQQVVNRSTFGDARRVNGSWFSRLFFNRTFALDSRDVYINSRGTMTKGIEVVRMERATDCHEHRFVSRNA